MGIESDIKKTLLHIARGGVVKRGAPAHHSRAVQAGLKNAGKKYWATRTGNITDVFGSLTDAAVRRFQTDNGLDPVDGKVGKATAKLLFKEDISELLAEHPLFAKAFGLARRARKAVDEVIDKADIDGDGDVDLDDARGWIGRVIGFVSGHEGGYASLNRNTDRAGLSFGIIQWAQVNGQLGKLLATMHATDAQRFQRVFGPHWKQLLDVTAKPSLDPVGGERLWEGYWVKRFTDAGNDPVFRKVQDDLARDGEHFQGALQAAKLLGITTERALILCYDTSVQQGPGFARKHARRIQTGANGASDDVLLTRFAEGCPAHFRKTSNPGVHPKAPRLQWKKVGSEWHVFAGKVDLYRDIIRRRTGIVKNPKLRDTVVLF